MAIPYRSRNWTPNSEDVVAPLHVENVYLCVLKISYVSFHVVSDVAVYRQHIRAKENAPDIHEISDSGVGERISLQPLLDQTATHRDRTRAATDRAPDQDLVPEQTHEVEEGKQRGEVDWSWRRR